MKNAVLILAAFAVLNARWAWASDVEWEDISRGNADVYSVLAGSGDPATIYFGSGKGIFKSEDNGESWKNIFPVSDRAKRVNCMLRDGGSLYAATGDGLFRSINNGKSWKRIFRGKNNFENECAAVLVLPFAVYAGTGSGLFSSPDSGRTWGKVAGVLGNSHVLALAADPKNPQRIYAACVEGVFRTQESGKRWEKIFTAHPAENGGDSEDPDEDTDEAERFSAIRYIAVDPDDPQQVYLATSGGVYKSGDRGDSWEMITAYGLLSRNVRFLLFSGPLGLCAATKTGVFRYKEQRWEELSFGLVAQEVRFLAADKKGNIYAACDKGLFRAGIKSRASGGDMAAAYSCGEPDISSVQEAAVKYAEVEPQKIILWRKQASRKALLPQVTFGVDRNTTDLWHWEGGSTTKPDDDTLRRGDDSIDWDVTVSWDLSEIIWNNDQTSIDTRSRLLVQLRNDILDEVTKLYFERIRIKMEVDELSLEERKRYSEKMLRLRELTASLDALTGGYFSKAIKAAGKA